MRFKVKLGWLKTQTHIVKNQSSLGEYQTITLLSALLNILVNIYEYNQFDRGQTMVKNLTFSPDGKIIASGIKLWHENGTAIATLSGHKDKVKSISFSPDGKIISSASQDGTIKLWQQNGTLMKTPFGHQNRVINTTSLSNNILISISKDGTVKFWQLDGTHWSKVKLKALLSISTNTPIDLSKKLKCGAIC
ncbi:MAG: hypothetical protein V7K98_12185 [Nostoc sp.]|uniref:WD40 repeat domain-containing protein n=1 Tax=Nostoc sp. TaxID=1180 RepID=UPI002FFB9B94